MLDDVFDQFLEAFTPTEEGPHAPSLHPLPVDSWIARSAMQKAIRRGMTGLALAAAAQLFVSDRPVLWRRLIVTALEDLGPGEFDVLATILAVARAHGWRRNFGEWRAVAELVKMACRATKCQSTNDLWNIAAHDSALASFKAELSDVGFDEVLNGLEDLSEGPARRAMRVLIGSGAYAGPDAPTHFQPQPAAVFEVLARMTDPVSVQVYREAYRRSGVALAGLAPCLPRPMNLQSIANSDDAGASDVSWIGDIPTFALDQYTRGGKAAIRTYVNASAKWKAFSNAFGLSHALQVKAAGELLFRAEGAAVARRLQWRTGMELRSLSMPHGCFVDPIAVEEGLAIIRSELPLVDQMRRRTLIP